MPSLNFTDQIGNHLTLRGSPIRIVSLVPSQTELLAELGLNEEVVGVTKFCVHPDTWRKNKKVIGGTKNFRLDIIHALKPDLIIGNKEENDQSRIEELQKDYPVWMSDIITVEDALTMIRIVGGITGKTDVATELLVRIQASFGCIKPYKFSVLYLIWKNPWMGVAPGTFIHSMLSLAGFENRLHSHTRYPELTDDELIQLDPEVVLLSSEPYPFIEKHIRELKSLLPNAKVVLVDGEMFSWYGSRMKYFAGYFNQLIPQLL